MVIEANASLLLDIFLVCSLALEENIWALFSLNDEHAFAAVDIWYSPSNRKVRRVSRLTCSSLLVWKCVTAKPNAL